MQTELLLQIGSWRLRWYKRSIIVIFGLLLLLALLSILRLLAGENLSVWQTIQAVLGVGDDFIIFLIQELRLPRLLAGILSGAALGASGCLLQTLAQNRLATPSIIGIDNGATAFAVAAIVAVPTSLAPSALALVGATTAAALAFGLSGGSGAKGYRFIMVGIGLGAVFGALTNLMLARTDMDSANMAYPWTVGSLSARSSSNISFLAICLVICLPWAMYLARQLNLMRFSDAVAVGLGVAIKRIRIWTLVVTVLLSAFAIALAGPVGLVALAAPEMARYLTGSRQVPVFSSALAGALIMIAADWIGQSLFIVEIPVGVIAAIVGGPYLLWILLRQPARGSL